MTPEQARAMYRRQMVNGETVTLKRGATTASVRAKISGYRPEELVGGINQGDRLIIMMAEDLVAAAWPDRPKATDAIILSDGSKLTVGAVDWHTRRVAGETIAYEITARG